jgi:hypothetical protein
MGLPVGGAAAAPAVYVRAVGLAAERLEQTYARTTDEATCQRYDYTAPAAVRPLRLSGQPRAAQVHGEAGEMFRVIRYLERVTGLVGRQIGNQDDGLVLTLDLVMDVNAICLHDWHCNPSSITATVVRCDHAVSA